LHWCHPLCANGNEDIEYTEAERLTMLNLPRKECTQVLHSRISPTDPLLTQILRRLRKRMHFISPSSASSSAMHTTPGLPSKTQRPRVRGPSRPSSPRWRRWIPLRIRCRTIEKWRSRKSMTCYVQRTRPVEDSRRRCSLPPQPPQHLIHHREGCFRKMH
jgi:hypothetical protein